MEEIFILYHDICHSGVLLLDIHIHTTIPYPILLIDSLESTMNIIQMTIQIMIKPKALRLHLVDCHRQTFYKHLQDYDFFIYIEDYIGVTPTTVASYLYETKINQ